MVVGHPLVLVRSPYWREVVRHCAARGAVRGAGAATITRLLRALPAGSYAGPMVIETPTASLLCIRHGQDWLVMRRCYACL